MTTGLPLYLVSACGSAEEFVAAFRRYADRTGLFIPSAAPLPAGRRGRLALTLKDGGVMIEGEAEILQSSAKPTVLHGRPGMTVKFVEPDEPSKTVIAELEKARLAMKPASPSVPPRPAEIPASPRAVPPAPSGRIDAANALAECVVIGDPATLTMTANAPRPAMGSFVVPSIPAVGAPRPKSPSTPPDIVSKPAPPAEPPKPAAVPNLSAAPLPPMSAASAAAKSGKMTSIGFPAVDKAPAKTESGRVVSPKAASSPDGSGASNATTLGMPALDRKPLENPLLQTKLGTEPPANPTSPSMPAQNPLLETKLGHAAPRADATPPKVPLQGTPPPDGGAAAKSITVHEETTAIGQGPAKLVEPQKPITAARPLVDPIGEDEATAIGAIPTKKTTDPMPAAAPKPTPPEAHVATPAAASAQRADNPRNDSKQKATALGFPVVGRNVFETQPLGIVPPASPFKADGTPQPPMLPKGGAAGRPSQPPAPRGKNPTTPPLTPRHPTPVAPVPIVRPPAKAAPSVNAEDEKTDLGTAPTAPAAPVEPASAIDSGALFPAPRSGGMRASEILAAIPAGDWTMAPDESVPHALPPDEKLAADAPQEPTPAPSPPPKGPPTGDWTIQLDPETGWSEPEKLAKQPAPVSSGNPIVAVSSDKPINVVQWDEKPTGIGESKIEVDSTLMEPLEPMPATDDDAAQIVDRPPGDVPPPLAPMPPRPTSGFGLTDQAFMPPMAPPHRQSSTDMLGGFAPMTVPIGPQDPAQRKKMILLAIAAGTVAVGAIVILVLTLGGSKRPSQAATGGSGGAVKVITPTPTQAIDAGAVGSGSQQVAVDPVGSGNETRPAPVPDKPPPPVASGPCKVDIKSNPPGADIYAGAQKLGTTPDSIQLPCGSQARLTLKKKAFPNTVRSFTPAAAKTNKLTVKLARPQFSVKMTSTPAGATITSGGKSLGVTPTTIKVPGFDSTALTLTKPGFAPETARVNPKQNNASHHVTLKRGKGR